MPGQIAKEFIRVAFRVWDWMRVWGGVLVINYKLPNSILFLIKNLRANEIDTKNMEAIRWLWTEACCDLVYILNVNNI